MAPFVVLLLGPEDRVCGIDDMRSALDTGRLTILPSLTVISCLKAIEAVQALNKAITTYGNVEAVFMHHNFCARGKEEFSDAIKTVLSQKYPHIPIICWGKVVKGGQQGRDFHYGLEWEAKSGSTPVVKVLGMLKSGQISTGKVGNGVASPRGSIDLQPQSSPRGSIEMASYQGGGSNVGQGSYVVNALYSPETDGDPCRISHSARLEQLEFSFQGHQSPAPFSEVR